MTEVGADLSWIPATREPTFGDRLRMLRDDLGLTLLEMAALCEIPGTSLSNWENNVSKPRSMDEVVEKIHAATAVNKVWLMFGTSLYKFRHLRAVATSTDRRMTSPRNRPPMLVMVRDDDDTPDRTT